ncbi:DsrE family protein [Halolamina sp. CBA1230]|uniref:DsrE family protein n=1 Tax=Halolamina sp. CBA1230 TaxID=1853690 RepID=UPI0009A19BD7|nr:DsrE family protein [Halolamina sp. CBA1230]QKY21044.1 DsrE family protein [Halolamina sp. CBA1230]
MHTVFHASTVDAYRTAEPKVRNLLDDETVDIDAVAVVVDSSEVIDAAADAESATTDALTDLGATVKLCSNAARGADAGEDAFGDGVEFVSSGVGELTRLQDSGWAYIRL